MKKIVPEFRTAHPRILNMKKLLLLTTAISFTLLLTTYHSFSQCETGYFNSMGKSGDDLVDYTTTDNEGNVYIAGSFEGATLIGNIALTSGASTSARFIAKFDIKGNVVWAEAIADVSLYGIVVDSDGDLFTVGRYYEANDITLPNDSVYSAAGNSDVITIKFTSDGNVAWARSIGTASYEHPSAIDVDANDNVYISGTYREYDIYFANDTLSSNGNTHNKLFVLKYDNDGNEIMGIHSTGNASVYFSGSPLMKVDGNGNIYVSLFTFSGSSSDTVSFGNNVYFVGDELFVMKYDSTGEAVWGYSPDVNDCMYARVKKMTLDDKGYLYIAGYFRSPSTNTYVVFGNDTIRHKYTEPAITGDRFIAKFDKNGIPLWASKAGSRDIGIWGITVDKDKNLYICGNFSYRAFFGDEKQSLDPYLEMISDAYFVKFDASGDFSWVKRLGGIGGGSSTASAIVTDLNGDVVSVGAISSTDEIIYDERNKLSISALNSYNIFMIKFNDIGDMLPEDFAGGDVSINKCENVVLSSLNYSGYSYSWAPVDNVSSPNSYTTSVSPDVSTDYILSMSNASCVYRDTVKVEVIQPVYGVNFSATPRTSKTIPVLVAFTNETPDPNDYDFIWSFGDGETSIDLNPIHTYDTAGIFGVSLTAISKANACRDSLAKSNFIVIDDTSSIDEINRISFSAYPNPITDNLNIEAPFYIEKIRLVNTFGQITKEKTVQNTNTTMSLVDFPSGMYYLQLFSEYGVSNKLIIIY